MYANIGDVKRVMGLDPDDTSRDDEIAAALQTADDYVYNLIERRYEGGTETATFYRVRSNGSLRVPHDATSVTAVEDENGAALTWRMAGKDRLRMQGTSGWAGWSDGFFTPRTFYYPEVHVSYTFSTSVPAAVRDATALLAADLVPEHAITDEEGNVTGLFKSERIGDYQYSVLEDTLRDGVKGNLRQKAMRLLRPYLKRKVTVV